MAFIDSPRFPEDISYGSSGGPQFNTTIRIADSGFEFSNINWENARRKYDISTGIKNQEDLYDIIKFFHITHGKGHYFRFKDWTDYKSCNVNDKPHYTDQTFGIDTLTGQTLVDGVNRKFQLVKTYNLYGTDVVNYYEVKKPVLPTLVIAIDGVVTTDYTINDSDNGVVTFTTAPLSGSSLTWGGEFDIPVRFDTDELNISLEFYQHTSTSISIIEVKI